MLTKCLKKKIDASEFPRSGYTATTAISFGPTIKSKKKKHGFLPQQKKPSNTKMSHMFLIAVTESEGNTHGIIAMAR